MEICQHCEMYMKPFIDKEEGIATCEFCGKLIAERVETKWVKVEPLPTHNVSNDM